MPTPRQFLVLYKLCKRAVITYFGIRIPQLMKTQQVLQKTQQVLQSSPNRHLLCVETGQVSMEILYLLTVHF